MEEKIEVKVRWDDILLAERRVAYSCAIARAVIRKTGKGHVRVGDTKMTVYNGMAQEYSLPSEATEFIKKFDKNRFSVRPFKFQATKI